MLDRSARVNRHLKSNKQTLKKGLPPNSEGANGDITIREIGGITTQYVKKNSKWEAIGGAGATVEKTVVITGSSSATAAGGGTASSNHSGLDNLSSDDHVQYVHNTIARTVSAAHTFSGNTAFTGVPTFTNIDVNGGNITGITDLAVADGGTGQSTLNDLITLGNHTTGNYMVNVTGNSQVSVSHTAAEGSTAALSIAADSIGDTQLAYNTGQHLTTTSAVTFATVDTGQGANDLYDMNQNVLTTSDVTFNDIVVAGDDITSSPFSSGFTGSGWRIDNAAHLEVSDATIRGTLSVYELLIQQIRATNGAIFVSSAAKVESASGLSASDDDGTITFEDPSDNNICPFAANDIIMMQRVNPGALVAKDAAGGATNVIKKLVYKVASVSGKTVTVEYGGYNNTSSPSEGDDFVRIGNTSDSARQGVIYLTSDDTEAPYIDIKSDIDAYSDWTGSMPKVRLGKLDGITDSDAGLDGSQSELYGLYSDTVRLKGHIHATSGKIGGISMASSKLYTGTGTYNNANTGVYIDSSSNFSLGNKLAWNNSTLSIDGSVVIGSTAASTIESGAASGATANQDSTSSIRSGTTKSNVGLGNVDNDSTSTIRAVGAATSGTVGGWTISSSAITGSNIVMSSAGSIAVSNGYTLNNDGSASFADGNITFAQNGDITSQTYLIERSRLFGDGSDSYNGSSYVDTKVHTNTRDSAYGESTYAINMPPKTASEVSNGYGQRIMYRDGNNWYMQADGYFKDFTVKNGVILYTKGYRLFCNGTLTVESGASIQNNGSTASSTRTGAAGGSGGTLHAGANGHDGGTGGSPGASGGNGGYGGGGGGSGGMILISARYLSNSGTIRASGGNGSNGQAGLSN